MAEQYLVEAFRVGNTDSYGNTAYYVDTDKAKDVYYKTKNKPPVVGQTFEWEFETNDKGGRFRNPSQQQGAQPSGGGGGGGAKRGGGYRDDPVKEARIVRQHAQKVASEHVNVFTAIDNPAEWEKFTRICDKLCEDVFSYADRAKPQVAAEQHVPTIEQARAEFQAQLKEAGLTVEDGVAAIGKVYNRTKLEPTDDITALIASAKETADADVPF